LEPVPLLAPALPAPVLPAPELPGMPVAPGCVPPVVVLAAAAISAAMSSSDGIASEPPGWPFCAPLPGSLVTHLPSGPRPWPGAQLISTGLRCGCVQPAKQTITRVIATDVGTQRNTTYIPSESAGVCGSAQIRRARTRLLSSYLFGAWHPALEGSGDKHFSAPAEILDTEDPPP
jgi:hypothetical protein